MGFTNPYPASRLTLDATASINSGLVAFYPLTDETSSTALDISGNYHNGTMTNGAYFTGSTGIGRCAFFDGSNDYCTTGNAALSIDGSVGSISFWFKSNASQTGARLFEFGSSGSTGRSIGVLVTSSGDVTFRYRQSSTNYNATGPTLSSLGSGWNFAVATWDASNNINLYINGTKYTSTRSGSINVGNLDRGYIAERALEVPLGEAFQGEMQNVRCWTVELSQAQVDLLYARPWEGTNYGDLWPYSPPAAASMTLSSDTAASSLMSGCQAWYPLTEGTGTTATCIMGHSAHNGTLDTGVTWETSERGTAAKFDGTNNAKITLGSEPVSGQTISVSAWVYSEETSGVQAIYCSRQSGFPDSKNYLTYNAGGPNFGWDQYQPSGGGTYSGTISDARGRWVHVVATQDATTSKIYVDGELKGSAASETYSSTAGAYYIGYRYSAQVMTGSIQNLRVWDRVLSADEALLLYERPWEGIEYGDTFHHDPPAPASMLPLTSDAINTDQEAWWPLTQTTGSTCTDISGNSLDGTQNGTEVWQNSELGYVHESSGTSQNYFDNCGSTSDFAFAHTTGIMTISCWIRPTATGRSFILANNDTSGANGFFFDRKNGNGMDFYMGTSGVGGTTSVSTANDTAPSDGSWQHWVFVLDTGNSVAQFYKNGVAVTTTGTIAGTGTGSTKYTTALGGLSSVPSETFDGDLQNVRVWSRALTADEIWSIYATNPWLGSNYKLASGSTLYNYIFRTERFRRLG